MIDSPPVDPAMQTDTEGSLQQRGGVALPDPLVAAIHLYGVSKTYATAESTTVALDEVSLQIAPQEFICIIGPSGCGKSTIVNLIAELETPTSGRVTIDGRSPSAARQARKIGMVFQDAVLLPWRTVLENLELPLEVTGMSRAARRRVVAETLKLVALNGFEKSFPHQLSGGMRQRLGIGRALSFDPEILLMDEPFGALDAITRDQMSVELLRIWQQRRKTVVFVTHSIDEAVLLSDRIVVMSPRPGRIKAIIDNPLPRPRPLDARDSTEFLALKKAVRHELGT